MNVQPVGHRVAVEVDAVPERYGNLYLPTTGRERQQNASVVGTLLAVGDQCWKEFGDGRPWCQVGDKVLIAKYGGYMMKDVVDGEERDIRILNDEDIIAKLEDSDG